MSYPRENWDRITKTNPDKDLADGGTSEDVCETGIGALEISGTLDITKERIECVIEAASRYDVPIYQEPSDPGAVIGDDTLDGCLISAVLNMSSSFWITGTYREWVRIGDGLDWDRTRTKACIVLNPESLATGYTDVGTDQSTEDMASFARVAGKMFDRKIIYVECSDTYDDPEKVGAARGTLNNTALLYGDSIHNYESAYEMGQRADAIVVDNLLHGKGADAMRKTIGGAKDTTAELVTE